MAKGHHSTPVPVPVPPQNKLVNVVLTDELHNTIAGVAVTISVTKDNIHYQDFTGITNSNGIAGITIPFISGNGSIIKAIKDGYYNYNGIYNLQSIPVNYLPIELDTVPQITPARDISILGTQFSYDGINPTKLLQLTHFSALYYFINDKNKYNIFTSWGRAEGFNDARVFACMKNIVDFDLRKVPNWPLIVNDFLADMRAQSFTVEMSLADCQLIFEDVPALKLFINQLTNVMSNHKHSRFDINEPFKNLPVNSQDWDVVNSFLQDLRTSIAPGVIYNLGVTNDESKGAYIPTGHYTTNHPPRDMNKVNNVPEWVRKLKAVYDYRNQYKIPSSANEPQGSGSRDGRDNDPIDHKTAAALSALYGNSCAHSDSLITCTIPTGVELDCVRAWISGWRSIPNEFLNGAYTRFGKGRPIDPPLKDEENIDARVYFSILGNRAFGVRISGKQNLSPSPGWKLINNDGIIYELELT